jgi:hypothetical protein
MNRKQRRLHPHRGSHGQPRLEQVQNEKEQALPLHWNWENQWFLWSSN